MLQDAARREAERHFAMSAWQGNTRPSKEEDDAMIRTTLLVLAKLAFRAF